MECLVTAFYHHDVIKLLAVVHKTNIYVSEYCKCSAHHHLITPSSSSPVATHHKENVAQDVLSALIEDHRIFCQREFAKI